MNYNLVINSQFRPYELSELMPIYQMNQQAQQQAEDAFTTLAVNADKWSKLANSAKDKDTYNRYKAYSDELHNQIDLLMNEGLNINSRKALMNLRSQYASQIVPIEEAYNKREQQADAIWKMYAQDPTLIMQYNPNDISLEDYINNPSMRPQLYSGKILTAQVAQQAQALANRITELKKSGKLDKYYDEITKTYGLSPQDVDDFLNGKVTNSFLSTIKRNVLQSSGISKWANASTLRQADSFMNQGLYSTIGKSDIALQRDLDVMTPMEEAQYQGQLLNNEYNKLQIQTALNQASDDNDLALNHDEGELDAPSSDEYKKYNELKKTLYVKNGTGGLSVAYAGHTYTNPMKIYEEYQKVLANVKKQIADKTPNTYGQGYSSVGRAMYDNISGKKQERKSTISAEQQALNIMKEKYGITAVLSKDNYNTLKELGYSNKSTRKDFMGGVFRGKLDSLAKLYRPTSTSLSEYSHPQEVILNNLYSNKDNLSTRVYEYKHGKSGSAITDLDDILSYDKNGKITTNITNISYSALQPDKLLITLDNGKKVFVSPNTYSSEAANLINQANEAMKKAKSNTYKSQLQDEVTYKLSQMFNNYQKIRSNTDSNI